MKLPHQKFSKTILIITAFFILSDCAYEFSEDSFTEITQQPPNAFISLNDLNDNQTFYVSTTINFNYNGSNKHLLYEIKIYIDDVLIKTSTSNFGDFIIDTESLEDSNHVLRVEYIFSSGSGSLADVSGVEAYVKTEEYSFNVDKSLPETVVMKSAEIIDGSIYLSWEPITKLNFDSVTLIITNNGSPNYHEITKQELLSLSYNDTYVHSQTPAGEGQIGHDLEYQIRLNNTRGNTLSNKVGFFIDPFEIEKLILNENQYKLIIPQHTLYNNFDYYAFNDYANNLVHKVSSHGGEIIVDESISFPNYGNIGVSLFLYKENQIEDIIKGSLFILESYQKPFEYDPSSNYGEFLYNQIDNLIYVLRTGSSRIFRDYITIEKLDSETLALVETKLITLQGANNAKDLTFTPTGDLIIDVVDITYLVDGNSLSIINEWKLSDFGVQTGSIKYRNNTIIIEQENQISFYDSTTKELFYSNNKSGYFKISDDGRYFYIDNTFYEINNKIINVVVNTNTNDTVNLVEFIDNQRKCIYNTLQGNPVILDLVSKSNIILDDFTGINLMNYDGYSNKVLFVRNEIGFTNNNPSFGYVYNLGNNSFKRLEVVNVSDPWYPEKPPFGYWFQKDKLIYASGLGWYLDHYINE